MNAEQQKLVEQSLAKFNEALREFKKLEASFGDLGAEVYQFGSTYIELLRKHSLAITELQQRVAEIEERQEPWRSSLEDEHDRD